MNVAPPRSASSAHVVVVGAGGLGCPAAWALAEAGVGRLTILDPDRVESSNLPRQVLYRAEDVGRPKAAVAAERLRGPGRHVQGLAAPLDESNEAAVLVDADVVLDATDGARTKDWLNALAVRRGLPLVHAAALRSEGRLLDVPAGGRPCLACLFGRLEEESGSCADLGVWNGAVGATGFLAAATVLGRLVDPTRPSTGYLMLDLEGGRAVTLAASAAADCPVCARAARLDAEPLPHAAPCAVPTPSGLAADRPHARLDLRDEVCPLNLLRARRAVEDLPPGAVVEILLGAEGAASVPDGLRSLGHAIRAQEPLPGGLRLLVARGTRTRPARRLERDQLLRYARQVVLGEVGEEGQARLLEARVRLDGAGVVRETAAVYLRAAGIGEVTGTTSSEEAAYAHAVTDGAPGAGGRAVFSAFVDARGRAAVIEGEGDATAGRLPHPEARALGALLADRVQRRIVGAPSRSLGFHILSGPRLET